MVRIVRFLPRLVVVVSLIALTAIVLPSCKKEAYESLTLTAQRYYGSGTYLGGPQYYMLSTNSSRRLRRAEVSITYAYQTYAGYQYRTSTRTFEIYRGTTSLGVWQIGQIAQVYVNGYPVRFSQY